MPSVNIFRRELYLLLANSPTNNNDRLNVLISYIKTKLNTNENIFFEIEDDVKEKRNFFLYELNKRWKVCHRIRDRFELKKQRLASKNF